jgi:hypothetical protein
MNPRLEEIEARANAVDRLACDLASGKKKWQMCVPPQSDDSDMMIVNLARTDVPYLLALARSLEAEVKALRKLDTCTRGGLMWNTIVAKADAIAKERENLNVAKT